jgi:hypothetical protein
VIVESQHLVVRDAERARWEWNKYGNPPGRRYYQEYVRRGDHIRLVSPISATVRLSARWANRERAGLCGVLKQHPFGDELQPRESLP